MKRSDRLGGLALIVLAVAYGLEARSFQVRFIADPIGPRAFPYILALLLGALGLSLIFARAPSDAEPAPRVDRRPVLGAVSLVAYTFLFPFAGFFVSTSLLMMFLSRLFGSRGLVSFVAPVLFVAGLGFLFTYGLAIPLPIGSLFGD